ncbi:hypothetical protein ACVWZL_008939 [Bradyrhizobium sp. GM2.4]
MRCGCSSQNCTAWLAAARTDSAVRRMMTVPGVGALVALTFRATVDDPKRFKKSTNVSAHFGLTPRRYQSGQTDRIGSISKCGDELTRAMLYEAAIAILTRIPKNFKLRLWGLRLARKKGLKRAATAVARALAVLPHKIWIDGTTFRFGAAASAAGRCGCVRASATRPLPRAPFPSATAEQRLPRRRGFG